VSDVVEEGLDAQRDAIPSCYRRARHRAVARLEPLLVQASDGAANDIQFRREVTEHGATRRASLACDGRGRRAPVTKCHDARDCGVEDRVLRRRARLDLLARFRGDGALLAPWHALHR